MLKNYFKIAFRLLSKYKSFSLINLTGLTLGITVCLLITQYVSFQLSYDQFHRQKESLYRVSLNYVNDKGISEQHAGISNSLGPFLKTEFPEIINQTRMIKSSAFTRTSIVKYNDGVNNQSREFHEDGVYFVDSSFLEMFTYPIVLGDSESPLANPYSIILSESAAKKYFGESNPIGKNLTFNSFLDFEVTGVFKDPPLNSHQKFNFLLSIEGAFEEGLLNRNNLHLYGDSYHTYIELSPNVNAQEVQAKIQQPLIDLTDRKFESTSINLQPITEIHLYSELVDEQNQNGSALVVFTLSFIALLVLMLAWSNFTNLSLLRNLLRTKETAVRKTLGALKHQLVFQFVLESLILNFIAFMLALGVAEVFQPYFSKLLGYNLPGLFSFNPVIFLLLSLLFAGGSVLTGLIPSLILSYSKPVGMLKSFSKMQSQGNSFRMSLVIFQLAAVFILITCTFTISKQMNFMQNKDLGLEVEQVLILNGPKLYNDASTNRTVSYKQFVSKYHTFKSEILRNSSVKAVSSTNYIPGDNVDFSASLDNPNSTTNIPQLIKRIFVNYDFDQVFELKMVAGRFFSEDFTDENNAIVLNESAIKQLGFADAENALHKEIHYWGNPVTIIGVTKDFHFSSLKNKVEPMFFWLNTERTFLTLKLNTENIDQTLATVNETWSSVFEGSPLHFFFADEYFNNQYKEEQKLETLITLFTGVSIVIAGLGLFGLVAFMIQRRTKEIGIRKVLGANVANVVTLLSKDFVKLVIVGFTIAIPIAWYAMNQWLADFAYRIELGPGTFVFTGGAAVAIALLTVSLQSLKAAVANPVESLKSE